MHNIGTILSSRVGMAPGGICKEAAASNMFFYILVYLLLEGGISGHSVGKNLWSATVFSILSKTFLIYGFVGFNK